MPIFTTYDGTELSYRTTGEGEPLVCLPGGPMRAAEYLGDLGGLAATRQLILPDLRGTGDSAVPADPATYRVDRQVADVEALRRHLGLDRMDLLAHSAGALLAQLYAAAHPQRLRRLVLVTPNATAVGLLATAEDRLAAVRLRAGTEPYDTAASAYARFLAGETVDDALWELIEPVFYGRWDETARAHAAAGDRQQNEPAADVYAGPGAFDPPATRAALRTLTARVLVLSGEYDGNPRPELADRLAALFPNGTRDTQPGAGHFPWLDDPEWFAARVERFLAAA
ncbi:alpha/beta hydrolase [Streptomyces venezuelae]|uniref:Alpha/beta hydrolase n=1 Tax=Streptomyces venezuelae TaxID=54571 RepID=A0A5P2D8X2_STRVZ|nr:alpha/beta hydrolase [Streptomyces venezuelae]QES51604.1 alpha/beta hydrolase [Streptomyces venezuelae]